MVRVIRIERSAFERCLGRQPTVPHDPPLRSVINRNVEWDVVPDIVGKTDKIWGEVACDGLSISCQ